MLDATDSSTRRTIMLYYILLSYYYYIIYHHTIILYIFIFLLFGFHFISNFAVIPFRKSLKSVFNCRVRIPGGMWSFLAETGHVGEWDRTSSTKSRGGGGVIWMPSKMKQGVPKNFSYICRFTQDLFGSWISGYERLQVFRAEGASNSAFHLDPPDQTTVKRSLRFGFVRGP